MTAAVDSTTGKGVNRQRVRINAVEVVGKFNNLRSVRYSAEREEGLGAAARSREVRSESRSDEETVRSGSLSVRGSVLRSAKRRGVARSRVGNGRMLVLALFDSPDRLAHVEPAMRDEVSRMLGDALQVVGGLWLGGL